MVKGPGPVLVVSNLSPTLGRSLRERGLWCQGSVCAGQREPLTSDLVYG